MTAHSELQQGSLQEGDSGQTSSGQTSHKVSDVQYLSQVSYSTFIKTRCLKYSAQNAGDIVFPCISIYCRQQTWLKYI